MKKLACLLLAVITILGLVSCGPNLKKGEKGPIIKMCISTLPDTFDPAAYAIDADCAKIYSLIYTGLTTLNAKGKLSKGLAYDWYYKPDTIYNEDKMYFKIYDTGWSDGRKVSAGDFVYAWSRILAPESNSPYACLLYPIKNAKKVKMGEMTVDDLGLAAADDTLLEIIFEEGYVKHDEKTGEELNGDEVAEQFAAVVSSIAFAPLREDKIGETWTTDFSLADVPGCGPFALRNYSNTKEQRKLELERNIFYRRDNEDKDVPLDSAVTPYKIIFTYDVANGELKKASEQYDAGELYYLGEFNKGSYDGHIGKIKSADDLSAYVCYFNTKRRPFEDARVRKALSLALDRTKIAEIKGCGAVPAGSFVPSGVFEAGGKKGAGFDPDGGIYKATADTEGAKALLKKAGVKGGEYTFTINFVDEGESDANKRVAEYAAKVWKGLGFDVETKGIFWGVDRQGKDIRKKLQPWDESGAKKKNEEFDVFMADFAMSSVAAEAYLLPFAEAHSGSYAIADKETGETSTAHFTLFSNADYNALADRVSAESDAAARAELLHQMEKLLVEQCPAAALTFGKNNYVASSKLSGYESYYNGAPDFTDTTLDGWREINRKIEAEEAAADEKTKGSK